MKNMLTNTDCIELSKKDSAIVERASPTLIEDAADPRAALLGAAGMTTGAEAVTVQKDFLIINDGNDVDTAVWKRLALAGARPVEVLSGEMLLTLLVRNEDIRRCLAEASVIIAPISAGPRVLDSLRKRYPLLIDSRVRVYTPSPDRILNFDRSIKAVILSEQDRAMLSGITDNDRVVILDDVASTYRTADVLARTMPRAMSIDLVTLAAVVPKQGDIPPLIGNGLRSARTALVTQRRSLDLRPGITTTVGIFDGGEKPERSRINLCRYLKDGGLSFSILQQRIRQEMKLLLLDLDGTALENGTMPEKLRTLLCAERARFFAVAATGRDEKDFSVLPAEIREVFRAVILDNGLSLQVNGSRMQTLKKRVDPSALRNKLKKSARRVQVQTKIMRQAANDLLPWCVRIRASGGNIETSGFSPQDTQAAMLLTQEFNNRQKDFSMQPSGYGDASIVWPGTGKGTCGLDGLARRLPTLPSLSTAIAAGDGPNDACLLKRVKDANGTSIAVNPLCDALQECATEKLDSPQNLSERLRLFLSPSSV